jgi:hypothetical protein
MSVHIDECDSQTRARVLEQIGETEGTTALAVIEPETHPLYQSAHGLEAPAPISEFRYMRTTALHAHPINQRIYGNEIPHKDFLKSIRDVGILEPLIVVEFAFAGEELKFYIVSGHRRWMAAQQLGMRRVPVRDGGKLYHGGTQEEKELSLERNLLEANRQREKTPEQRAREFEEVLRIQTAIAAQRKLKTLKRGNSAPVKDAFPERETGQARDLAARETGSWSGQTALKMAAIVRAADSGNKEAKLVVAAINAKTDSIHNGYSKVAHLLLPLAKRKRVEARAINQGVTDAIRIKKLIAEIEAPVPPNKSHLKLLATVLELMQRAEATLSEVTNVESIEEYEALTQVHEVGHNLFKTDSTITAATKNKNRHAAEVASRKFKGQYSGSQNSEERQYFKRFVAQQGWLCTGGYQFIKVMPVANPKPKRSTT